MEVLTSSVWYGKLLAGEHLYSKIFTSLSSADSVQISIKYAVNKFVSSGVYPSVFGTNSLSAVNTDTRALVATRRKVRSLLNSVRWNKTKEIYSSGAFCRVYNRENPWVWFKELFLRSVQLQMFGKSNAKFNPSSRHLGPSFGRNIPGFLPSNYREQWKREANSRSRCVPLSFYSLRGFEMKYYASWAPLTVDVAVVKLLRAGKKWRRKKWTDRLYELAFSGIVRILCDSTVMVSRLCDFSLFFFPANGEIELSATYVLEMVARLPSSTGIMRQNGWPLEKRLMRNFLVHPQLTKYLQDFQLPFL